MQRTLKYELFYRCNNDVQIMDMRSHSLSLTTSYDNAGTKWSLYLWFHSDQAAHCPLVTEQMTIVTETEANCSAVQLPECSTCVSDTNTNHTTSDLTICTADHRHHQLPLPSHVAHITNHTPVTWHWIGCQGTIRETSNIQHTTPGWNRLGTAHHSVSELNGQQRKTAVNETDRNRPLLSTWFTDWLTHRLTVITNSLVIRKKYCWAVIS